LKSGDAGKKKRGGAMTDGMKEEWRRFEFTSHEYLTRCTDGCGEITGWMESLDAAAGAGRVHNSDRGHHWEVANRLKERCFREA
jgi:hypothetical protein